MRMLTYILTAVALGVGAANVSQASDDLTIISKKTTNGKAAGVSTEYISSDYMRLSTTTGGTIFDLKNGVTTTLDATDKTYYVTTKRDIEAMGAMIAAKMKDPKAKQSTAMMQGMGISTAAPEVTKTGETRKVAGFNCDVWKFSQGCWSITTTQCVTTELKYPVSTRTAFMDYGETLRKAMRGAGGPSADAANQLAEKMKAIKGFPVATSTMIAVGGMKQTTDSEVTEVQHTAIPASTWAVPAGYTKTENPMAALAQH